MQHWLDKLVDLAALRGDEGVLKDALTNLAHQSGFSGYAYLFIRPGHTIASSNYPPERRSIYFKGIVKLTELGAWWAMKRYDKP